MESKLDALADDTEVAALKCDNPLEELAIGVIIAQRMYVCEDGHLHVPRKPPPCVAKKKPSRIILP